MTIANELDKAMAGYRKGGISQAELAKLSGVPQPTISRTLKGLSVPETKTLIKLARALNCTLGGYTGGSSGPAQYERAAASVLVAREPLPRDPTVAAILKAVEAMTKEGQLVLLGRAQELAKQYARSKAKRGQLILFPLDPSARQATRAE